MTVVVVGLGVWLLLVINFAFAIRSWRGRTPAARRWAGSAIDERKVTMSAPGLFVGTTFGIGYVLAGRPDSRPLFYFFAIGMLAGFSLAALAGIVNKIPSWWGPRWLREMPKCERVPNASLAMGALERSMTAGTGSSPEIELDAKARIRAELGVLGRRSLIRARWVRDNNPEGLDHGMGFYGAVSGWLAWSSGGVVFCSSNLESSVRGAHQDLRIERSEIRSVQTIGRLVGPDGERGRGVLNPRQRLSPRLRIETVDQVFVLEALRAKSVTRSITACGD